MNRKRKQEVIEFVIESLEMVLSPEYNIDPPTKIRVGDCIDLLNEYHKEEFMVGIADKNDIDIEYDLPDYLGGLEK